MTVDIDMTWKPLGYSVLKYYLEMNEGEHEFDIILALIEAEPELLL